jgi:hypothetical protein
MEDDMTRGSKAKYTGRQKRRAEHIEEGYEDRGVPAKEAKRRAWATVNKIEHGGRKSGSGRGTKADESSSHKGGRRGGHAAASRPASARRASAKKAAATRKKRASHGTKAKATKTKAASKSRGTKSKSRSKK